MSNGYGNGGSMGGGGSDMDQNQSDPLTQPITPPDEASADLAPDLSADANPKGDPADPSQSASLDIFDEMVQKMFPDPEILDIKFLWSSILLPPDEIEIKVKVSGDFLDDEWFWADWLDFFKLKVFLISELDGINKDFYETSLFDEVKLSGYRFSYFQRLGSRQGSGLSSTESQWQQSWGGPTGEEGNSIESLINQSNKLENAYIFKGRLKLDLTGKDLSSGGVPVSPILRNNVSAIVARTFFDVEKFKKEFVGSKEPISFLPLTEENNGKWDVVEIGANSVGGITSINRLYAFFLNNVYFNNIKRGDRWDAAFSTDYVVTDDVRSAQYASGIPPYGTAGLWRRPLINFSRETFENTNVQLSKIQKVIFSWINSEKEITLSDYDNYQKLKFPDRSRRAPAFSNLGVTKDLQDDLNLYFAVDYLLLFEQFSILPESVFKDQENLIRNYWIKDFGAGNIKTGKYMYRMGVTIRDETEKFILNKVDKLMEAIKNVDVFNTQAQIASSVDPQTGEFTEIFITRQANNTLKNLNKAVDILYNILESNLLNNFKCKLSCQNIRVKQNHDLTPFDESTSFNTVVQTGDISPYIFNEDILISEFGRPNQDFEITTNLSFPRSSAKETFKIENMNLSKAMEFQSILENFSKQLISLVDEKKTPAALSQINTGWKTDPGDVLAKTYIDFGNDVYDADENSSGYSFGDPSGINVISTPSVPLTNIIYPGQMLENNKSVDQYLFSQDSLSNVNRILPRGGAQRAAKSEVMFNSLSLNAGFDFEFIGSPIPAQENVLDLEKVGEAIETLDLDDQKYLTQCDTKTSQAIEKRSTQNLFLELSSPARQYPSVEIQYLHGFRKNKKGKNIMKGPIWLSVRQLTRIDNGREILCRVMPIEGSLTMPIRNKYFVHKVSIENG